MSGGAGVVPNQPRAGADPLRSARRPRDPERHVEAAAPFGDAPDRDLDPLAVVRLQPGQEQLVTHRLAGFDSEQDSGRLRPLQFQCLEIEIPGPDAKSFDSDAEMFAPAVILRMNHTGRRQTITPIPMRRTAQRYRSAMYPRRGQRQVPMSYTIGRFPAGAVIQGFDLSHPARRRRAYDRIKAHCPGRLPMTYATVMVSLALDQPNEARLQVAGELAERFEASIIGVAAAQFAPPLYFSDGAAAQGLIDEEKPRSSDAWASSRRNSAPRSGIAADMWNGAVPWISRRALCSPRRVAPTSSSPAGRARPSPTLSRSRAQRIW